MEPKGHDNNRNPEIYNRASLKSLRLMELLENSSLLKNDPANSFSNSLATPEYSEMERNIYSVTFSTLKFQTHEAAKTGNLHELQKLFASTKENPFRIDYADKTALHHAANFGNPKVAHAMSQVILNCQYLGGKSTEKARLVNLQDELGETALHLAAKNAHRKVVELLINNLADVNIESKEKKEAIELVYTFVPQAMTTLFDASVTSNYTEMHEEKFEVNLDFGSIVGLPGPHEPTLFKETELLKYALNGSPSRYKDLLLHPLVQLFLHYKWQKIQVLFAVSMFFHIAWLLVYSIFVVNLYLKKCPYIPNPPTHLESNLSSGMKGIECPIDQASIPLAWILVSASLITFLKEVYELCTAPNYTYYFMSLENVGQILVILATAVAAFPVLKCSIVPGPTMNEAGTRWTIKLCPWSYQIAAYGVFLSWTLILLQIGKTPRLGIYVEVLVKVLKSFGLFIVTFISLLTAFALSFSILMPQNEMFSSIPRALSTVLVMMTGELNYSEVFYNDEEDTTPFPVSGELFFAAFVIMITIILFNLLIGFTVSDIQGLQETASVSRLSNQLEQIHLMESFLFSSGLASFLRLVRLKPETWLRRFMVTGHSHEEPTSTDPSESFSAIVTKTTKQIPRNLRTKVKKLAILILEGSSNLHEENESHLNSILTESQLKTLITKAVCDTLITHFHIPPKTAPVITIDDIVN